MLQRIRAWQWAWSLGWAAGLGPLVGCDLSSGGHGRGPNPNPTIETQSSCNAGRPVEFALAIGGAVSSTSGFRMQVAAHGDDGFLLFEPGLPELIQVSPQGEFVNTLPGPAFDLSPVIDRVVTLADGSRLLSGITADPPLARGWLGKVDADWNPVWDQQLDLQFVEHTELEALPDGSAVVAGVRTLDREGGANQEDVFLARFSPAGELLWARSASFEDTHSHSEPRGFRILARTEQGIHLVVATGQAVFRVQVDLDGNIDPESLATPVPEIERSQFTSTGHAEPVGIEALSDGGVALYTFQHVMVLDEAGQATMRHDATPGEYISAVRFDKARNELVTAGQQSDAGSANLPGPFIRSLRSDGQISWEERRPPLILGTTSWNFENPTGRSAAPLYNAAIDDRGNMLMTGNMVRGLEWAWVGTEACGG